MIAPFNASNSHQQHETDTAVVPSNPTLAILSGYGITIWECLVDGSSSSSIRAAQRSDPVTRYPHGDLPVSTLAWNHNRMVLATASDVSTDELDHPNVVLTSSQTGNQLDSFRHNQQWNGRPAGVANSVHFGGKSRYLCIGDETGAVCLWDLKKRVRVRQFFHDEYPSRQVSLDPSDTYVLSLSPHTISVYNLRDGNLLGRLTPSGQALFTKFHVSPLEPKIAATGTTDGSVLLYDITIHDRSAPFFGLMRRHSGPVTGVAFSPVNPKVLVSCGEDGTVMIFDTETGETIQQVCALSTPINSITVHSDGSIVAVGCESGQVLLYDMRRQQFGAEPLASLQLGGPVKQIQFAPALRSKDQQTMLRSGAGPDHANSTATPAKFQIAPTPSSSSTYGLNVNTHDDNRDHAPIIMMQRSSESSTFGSPQAYAGPPGSAYHGNQNYGLTPATIRNTGTAGTNQHKVLSPTRSAATMSAAGGDSLTNQQKQPPHAAILATVPPQAAPTTNNDVQQYGRQQTSPQKTASSPSARYIMSRGMRASATKTGSTTKGGSPSKTISPTKNTSQSNSEGSAEINAVSSEGLHSTFDSYVGWW
jgi:WD40 repeat protein